MYSRILQVAFNSLLLLFGPSDPGSSTYAVTLLCALIASASITTKVATGASFNISRAMALLLRDVLAFSIIIWAFGRSIL
jgi:hypothetical protein